MLLRSNFYIFYNSVYKFEIADIWADIWFTLLTGVQGTPTDENE